VSVPEVAFDHYDPDLVEGARKRFTRLRAGCPVAHTSAHGGFYLVSTYPEAVEVLRDSGTFSSRPRQGEPGGTTIPPLPFTLGLLSLDPPEHTAYRQIVMPYFSAAAVERMRPRIRELVTGVIDTVIEAGHCDAVKDLTEVLPTLVTLDFLGLPADRCEPYIEVFYPSRGGKFNQLGAVDLATDPLAPTRWVMDDLRTLITERAPEQGKLVAALMDALIDGRPIPVEEVVLNTFVIIAGGTENMTAMMTAAIDHLDRNPADRERLARSPALIPAAVEELLRYYPGATTVMRNVVRPTRLGDAELVPGDRVMLSFLSANADAPGVADPGEFRIERRPNPHITFGFGRHRCVAATLAHVELELLISELVTRMPDYAVDRARVIRPGSVPQANNWHSMPVTFTPGPRAMAPGEQAGR
jgi:cytochrome P450